MLRPLPQCAANQQQRLVALRQEQEIEQLREYLVQYNIIVKQKDMKSVPIRMEDLKELAKRWKLHQQSRNFWREHTERDDLVRALLSHLRSEQHDHDKPDSQQENNTTPGINTISTSYKSHHLSPSDNMAPTPEAAPIISGPRPSFIEQLSPLFQWKKTSGDLFSQHGSYSDGIIYLSRVKLGGTNSPDSPNIGSKASKSPPKVGEVGRRVSSQQQMLDSSNNNNNNSGAGGTGFGQSTGVNFSGALAGTGMASELALRPAALAQSVTAVMSNAVASGLVEQHIGRLTNVMGSEEFQKDELLRRQVGESLYNLSCQPGVELQMIQEGVLDCLQALSRSEDHETKRFVSATLVNLIFDRSTRAKFVQLGGLACLFDMAMTPNTVIRRNCAVSLCILAADENTQFRLLEAGAAVILLQMFTSYHDSFPKICSLRGLISLTSLPGGTFVENGIMSMEAMAKMFDEEATVTVCRAALNLSIIGHTRGTIVEEGIMSVLHVLSKNENLLIQRELAMCLRNLVAIRGNVERMVKQGILGIILSQCMIGDPELDLHCSACIAHLASNPKLPPDLVYSGFVPRLNHLSLRDNVETKRHTALAYANLSWPENLGHKVVKDGAVGPLIQLLDTPDIDVKTDSVIALCNLVAHVHNGIGISTHGGPSIGAHHPQKAHSDSPTVSSGPATSNNMAASSPRLNNIPSNIVTSPNTSLMDDGIIPALVTLSNADSVQLQEVCSLALLNLSCNRAIIPTLASRGVIGALINLCASDHEVINMRCITALFYICTDLQSCSVIVREGGLPVVVHALNATQKSNKPKEMGANQEDLETREMKDIITSGSAAPHHFLTSPGATMRGGSLAFSATTPGISTQGISGHNVGGASASETNRMERQQFCAFILQQISLLPESRQEMVDSGAVESIVGLSQSGKVSVTIKRACASILCNLCMVAMDEPKLISTLVTLSHTTDEQTLLLCSYSFSQLSHDSRGRKLLASQDLPSTHTSSPAVGNITSTLISMMRSGFGDTQTNSAVTLCNLAQETEEESFSRLWSPTTVQDFIVIAVLRVNSDSTKEMCARAMYNLLCNERARESLVEQGVLYAMVKLARLESPGNRELCIGALYKLSSEQKYVNKLYDIEVVKFFYQIIDDNLSVELRRLMAHVLCNLVGWPGHFNRFIEQKGLQVIKLLSQLRDLEIRISISNLLCNLTSDASICSTLTNEKFLSTIVVMGRLHDESAKYYSMIALCNISAHKNLLQHMSEAEAVETVVNVMRSSKSEDSKRIGVRALRNLIVDHSNAMRIVETGAVEVLAQVLNDNTDKQTADIAAKLLCILTEVPAPGLGPRIVKEGIVKALLGIAKLESDGSRLDVLYSLCSLSQFKDTHELMLEDGVVEALLYLVPPSPSLASGSLSTAGTSNLQRDFTTWAALTVSNLSCTTDNVHRAKLGAKHGLFSCLVGWAETANTTAEAKRHIATALYNLSSVKKNTALMVHTSGCVKLLIHLSQAAGSPSHTSQQPYSSGKVNHATQQMSLVPQHVRQLCAMTLNRISVDQPSGVMEDGLVSSLSGLMAMDKANVETVEREAVQVVRLPFLNSNSEQYVALVGSSTCIRHSFPSVPWRSLNEPVASIEMPNLAEILSTHAGAVIVTAEKTFGALNSPSGSNASVLSQRSAPPRQSKEDETVGSFSYMKEEESKCFLSPYKPELEQPAPDSSPAAMSDFKGKQPQGEHMIDKLNLPITSQTGRVGAKVRLSIEMAALPDLKISGSVSNTMAGNHGATSSPCNPGGSPSKRLSGRGGVPSPNGKRYSLHPSMISSPSATPNSGSVLSTSLSVSSNGSTSLHRESLKAKRTVHHNAGVSHLAQGATSNSISSSGGISPTKLPPLGQSI